LKRQDWPHLKVTEWIDVFFSRANMWLRTKTESTSFHLKFPSLREDASSFWLWER